MSTPTFDVRVSEVNIVNPQTGELMSPEAFVDAVREHERSIGYLDEQIGTREDELTKLRASRKEAIAGLRKFVRESQAREMPLFGSDSHGADAD